MLVVIISNNFGEAAPDNKTVSKERLQRPPLPQIS